MSSIEDEQRHVDGQQLQAIREAAGLPLTGDEPRWVALTGSNGYAGHLVPGLNDVSRRHGSAVSLCGVISSTWQPAWPYERSRRCRSYPCRTCTELVAP